MKINIVTEPKPGWVLRMVAENWCRYLPDCSITDMKPNPSADINFYVNWAIFNLKEKTSIDIGWFTHKENQDFEVKSRQLDYCIAMSKNTLRLLPENKSSVVECNIGREFRNVKDKIKFGIVGRNYPSGRKSFDVIHSLKSIPNSDFLVTGGRLAKKEMVGFYESIDYLLITASNEGGPVPVLEAMRMGVPVIAPDVGWCWEYPVIKYNNTQELYNIIESLCSFVEIDKKWKKSSDKLLAIFKHIYNKRKE